MLSEAQGSRVYTDRLARVRTALGEQAVDALLVSQPESRYFLSGYRGHDLPPRDSAGYLLIAAEAAYLLTDPRTSQLAEAEAPDYQVAVYSNVVTAIQEIARLAKADRLKRLAFESVHLPYLLARQLREALAPEVELVESTDLVDRLRILKDPQELEALRAAIKLLDQCMAHVADVLEPGRAETEIAGEVERFLKIHASECSFAPIVASGPNAAVPHAVPTDRALQPGEPITIDIGARVNGYASDMTRTVCLGEAPPRLREIYSVVLRAQERAEREIQPGMSGREADRLAREVIEQAGFGEAFGHGTGHGIGLEVHEPPWLSQARGDHILQPGMVFSVEPGIYLPGWGGVRIEDLVVLQQDGVQVLSGAPKRLELPLRP